MTIIQCLEKYKAVRTTDESAVGPAFETSLASLSAATLASATNIESNQLLFEKISQSDVPGAVGALFKLASNSGKTEVTGEESIATGDM